MHTQSCGSILIWKSGNTSWFSCFSNNCYRNRCFFFIFFSFFSYSFHPVLGFTCLLFWKTKKNIRFFCQKFLKFIKSVVPTGFLFFVHLWTNSFLLFFSFENQPFPFFISSAILYHSHHLSWYFHRLPRPIIFVKKPQILSDVFSMLMTWKIVIYIDG